MRLLAIDTALEDCAVGLVDGDRPPHLHSETIGRGHAERLLGMIDAMMSASGFAYADLDRLAVTIGPGSFTGLRVGIAAARGIALVVKRPVVGIGTLDCHAESARAIGGRKPVLAVLDAGRDEIYGAIYEEDGLPRLAPAIAPASYFAEHIPADALIAGSGADLVAAAVGGHAAARIVHRRSAPELAALCRLGLAAPSPEGKPSPLYLRPPDAKPQTAGRIARR